MVYSLFLTSVLLSKKNKTKTNKPFDLSITWHLIKDSNPYYLVLTGSYKQVKWVPQCNLFLHILVKTKCCVAEGLNGEPSVLEYLYKLENLSVGFKWKSHIVEK